MIREATAHLSLTGRFLKAGACACVALLLVGATPESVGMAFEQTDRPRKLRHFVGELVGSGVPVGVVMKLSTLDGADSAREPIADEPLEDLLRTWSRSRSDASARMNGAVARFEDIEIPSDVRDALSLAVRVSETRERVSVGLAMSRFLLSAVNGGPVGIVGGTRSEPACALQREVSLPSGSVLLEDYLDTVIQQAPGLGWVLTYSGTGARKDINVGVICKSGNIHALSLYGS